jgi:hypothetical protein
MQRKAMCVAGRELVAEHYTWDAIGARLRAGLSEWLAQQARNGGR